MVLVYQGWSLMECQRAHPLLIAELGPTHTTASFFWGWGGLVQVIYPSTFSKKYTLEHNKNRPILFAVECSGPLWHSAVKKHICFSNGCAGIQLSLVAVKLLFLLVDSFALCKWTIDMDLLPSRWTFCTAICQASNHLLIERYYEENWCIK